ncbi:MAG: hypothetical protein KF773_04900 [Deltaproteobacteria bacterium]|nr:hypothetical protein [Deltaproteobacteria bacterium]
MVPYGQATNESTQAQTMQGTAQPTTQPPQQQPQLPASIPPISTEATSAQTDQAPVQTEAAAQSQGQWVYTEQYGWVWMPYSDAYVYTPEYATGGYPYQYVYYPSYGWTWLVAPWIWGIGITPFFVFGGFHHNFFVHLHQFHGGAHVAHFRGGFRQPAGFRAPVARTVPGHAFTGGHTMGSRPMGGPMMGGRPMGGPMMGGHAMGGPMMGGHGMGGGFGGGGGFHGGGGGGGGHR